MSENEIIIKIGELVEQTGHAIKLLVSSEIAINDGDIASSQKFTREVRSLLSVMVRDIFVEISENFLIHDDELNDYDMPCTLELVKQLAEVQYSAGVYVGIVTGDTGEDTRKIVETKLQRAMNTTIEIVSAIYEN